MRFFPLSGKNRIAGESTVTHRVSVGATLSD